METLEVGFHADAVQDLREIAAWLKGEGASRRTVDGYTARIEHRCRRIGWAPRGGMRRPMLGADVRSVSFERTATIIYRVEPDRVLILRILRRGRDVARALTP